MREPLRRRYNRIQARCELANALVAFRQVRDAGKTGELGAADCLDQCGAAAELVLIAAAACVRHRAGVGFAEELVCHVAELADRPSPDLAFSVEEGLHPRRADDVAKPPPTGRMEYLRLCATRDLLNAYAAFCDASIAGVIGEERRDAAARRTLDAARRCVELGSNEPLAERLLTAWLENERLEK
jgi:hypothetical protein